MLQTRCNICAICQGYQDMYNIIQIKAAYLLQTPPDNGIMFRSEINILHAIKNSCVIYI